MTNGRAKDVCLEEETTAGNYFVSNYPPYSFWSPEHAGEAYKIVRAELSAYGKFLADKPEIVVLNKADALTPDELKQQKMRLKRAAKQTPLVMSAATGARVRSSRMPTAATLRVNGNASRFGAVIPLPAPTDLHPGCCSPSVILMSRQRR